MAVSIEKIVEKASSSYEMPNRVCRSVSPLVSVRTSTYNHGAFIRQCIEGVLMQKTNFAFEYIIGEDCSTDETRKIVLEYAQKYPEKIRVITADENVGATVNAYRCMQAVRGQYVAMCEGDDFWIDEYKLQKQFDYMESHPNCAICSTMGIERSFGESADTIKPLSGPGQYSHGWFINGRTGMLTAAAFYRVEYYRPEVSYNSKILIGDWALLASLTEDDRTCDVLPSISVVYRQHSGGVWSGRRKDHVYRMEAKIIAFEEYLCHAPAHDHSSLRSHIRFLEVQKSYVLHKGSRVTIIFKCLQTSEGRAFLGGILKKKCMALFYRWSKKNVCLPERA